MKALIEARWDTLRTSYWVVPSVLTIVAVVCVTGMLHLDHRGGPLVEQWWVYQGEPEGARLLVSTIIGSMITVVSVVFSVTMVTLTLASNQFGPRLLQSFMRDTMNQIVLGMFIATFIYHLLILGSISSVDGNEFVPDLSVTFGVGMVFVCVWLLIFFIHNVSTSIQADKVIARVHKELDVAISRLFPGDIGLEAADTSAETQPHVATLLSAEAAVVDAARDRYIQVVEYDTLLRLAVEHDKIIQVCYRPGEFVIKGTPLLRVWPADGMNENLRQALQESIVLGDKRTLTQDAEFGIDQLVEIAVRALPPGINDPFTVIACIDHLGSALSRLAKKQFPSIYRYDEQGKLRLKAKTTDFCGYFDAAFTQIRQNSAANPSVLIHLMEVINQIAEFAGEKEQRECIDRHRKMIKELGLKVFDSTDDQQDLLRRVERGTTISMV